MVLYEEIIDERTVSVDPASIAAGSTSNEAVTVTGAKTTDIVEAIPPSDFENGLVLQAAWVSAADTVTLRLSNVTGAAIDGAAKNWTIRLKRKVEATPKITTV